MCFYVLGIHAYVLLLSLPSYLLRCSDILFLVFIYSLMRPPPHPTTTRAWHLGHYPLQPHHVHYEEWFWRRHLLGDVFLPWLPGALPGPPLEKHYKSKPAGSAGKVDTIFSSFLDNLKVHPTLSNAPFGFAHLTMHFICRPTVNYHGIIIINKSFFSGEFLGQFYYLRLCTDFMANCTILIFRFDRRFNIMLLKSMSLYVVVYLCCILFVYGAKRSFKTRNQACYPLCCSTSVPKNGAHVLDWPDSE